MSRIAQFAELAAKPGRGEQVAAALSEAKAAAALEPGTLAFAIHTSSDDPDLLWVYELYESKDAQIAHSSSAATAALRAALADLLVAPLSVRRAALREGFGLASGGSGHG